MEAVASEVGVKHPVLSRIENGRYEGLSLALLLKLCNFYKVSLEEVLGQKVMQVFNFSQNEGTSNTGNNMRQVVYDNAEGYKMVLEQAQAEIKFLRALLENRMRGVSPS
ncbi:MAG: helix-turn-helix domain-containing protein [Chitinophagaceae bacterium]